MSCSGENSFGYVEIKGDKVISYTGDPSNPTINKFCNDEIVKAVNTTKHLKDRLKLLKTERDMFIKTFKGKGELDTHILDYKIEELEEIVKRGSWFS